MARYWDLAIQAIELCECYAHLYKVNMLKMKRI